MSSYMYNHYTFTTHDGDTLVEDVTKATGMGISKAVREGLMLLCEKSKGKDYKSCPLPGWEHFEKVMLNSDKKQVEETLSKCRQLVNISQRILSYKEGIIKVVT